jgi:protein TilB
LDENGEVLVPHTPEARLQYARELAAKRGQNDRTSQTKPNNIQPKRDTNPKFHPETNRILQRNDAELEFQWREFPNHVVLDLSFSKTIDTSLIDLDIHPTWITVEYKGKALHLATPCEVRVSDSTAQRSQITGHLVLTMPRVQIDPHLARLMPDAESGAQTFTGYVAGRKSPEKRNDLPSLTKKPWNQSGALRVREVRRTPVVPDSQFTDDPEVPPLI